MSDEAATRLLEISAELAALPLPFSQRTHLIEQVTSAHMALQAAEREREEIWSDRAAAWATMREIASAGDGEATAAETVLAVYMAARTETAMGFSCDLVDEVRKGESAVSHEEALREAEAALRIAQRFASLPLPITSDERVDWLSHKGRTIDAVLAVLAGTERCDCCDGDGYIQNRPCVDCGGTGRVAAEVSGGTPPSESPLAYSAAMDAMALAERMENERGRLEGALREIAEFPRTLDSAVREIARCALAGLEPRRRPGGIVAYRAHELLETWDMSVDVLGPEWNGLAKRVEGLRAALTEAGR